MATNSLNRITRWLEPNKKFIPQQLVKPDESQDWPWWVSRPMKFVTMTNRRWIELEQIRLFRKKIKTKIQVKKIRIALFRGV